MSSTREAEGPAPERRPPEVLVYEIASHRVRVSGHEGAWRVDVDRAACPVGFATVAEAWAAGVREADRLDRLARGEPSPPRAR